MSTRSRLVPAARRGRIAAQRARNGLAAARAALRGESTIDVRDVDRYVDDVYRMVLGRPADRSGIAFYGDMLRSGMERERLVLLLALSEESVNRLLAERFPIQDLRELRPEGYRDVAADDGRTITVFEVRGADDFDWLERSILDHGYYEKPGIWTLGVDEDKRRMAELLSLFHPAQCLEVGCSSGAILSCLHDRGVAGEGVEISAMAIQRADPAVRGRIHHGDLLTVALPHSYDLVYGLDVFEHFNPNRLSAYLERVAALTTEGGFVFVNVPTWGADRVYGTIWEPYLPQWRDDVAADRLFSDIEVDKDGYPVLGHLVWAGSQWWEEQFAAAGLVRETSVELALHGRFDGGFDDTPARKAFYVFSRDATRERVAELAAACG